MAEEVTYDREITIAKAKSHNSKNWKNTKLLWSEFVKELSTTKRTGETVEQFKDLDKTKEGKIQKAKIKDSKGGFVGGSLKSDGERNKDTIKSRSIITFDIDHCSSDIWDDIKKLNFACCLYSTHSHRADYQRYRLIIPLDRDVSIEEYEPISRMVASKVDIEVFDTTTHQPGRLMYWPSTPKDGEYIFEFQGGEFLNADEVLAEYTFGWKDISSWPISRREHEKIKSGIINQADPLEKTGDIGAFCRTYSITEAIRTFLSDVYELSTSGDRATYINGSTTGGVVIYDDKFSYSHHSTDPASNILCNAFDLVRLHKFGNLDEDVRSNTKPGKYPSHIEMVKLIRKDKNVSKTQSEEQRQEINEEFGVVVSSEDIDDTWKKKLERNENGCYLASRDNIRLIVLNDPYLKGNFYFDLFECEPKVKKPLLWSNKYEFKSDQQWSDTDDSYLKSFIAKYYGISIRDVIYNDAMNMVFNEVSVHPIKEYLKNSLWDGEMRVETLLSDYLGAEDTKYNRMIVKKMLVAAVKRVLEPGCKYEELVILVSSKQGIGKSTLVEKLGGRWYSDTFTIEDIKAGTKQTMEQTEGSWIIELPDLKGLSSKDADRIKAFQSGKSDKARKAYGRRVSKIPRQFIIIGTTNNQEFLSDRTGNRRYLPVTTDLIPPTKDVFNIDTYEINQIWAEAFNYYEEGYPIYLNKEEKELAAEQQKLYVYSSEEESDFLEYINKSVLKLKEGNKDWYSLDLNNRLNYLYQSSEFMEDEKPKERVETEERTKICITAIYDEFYSPKHQLSSIGLTNEIENNIKNLLIKSGWRKCTQNKEGKLNFGVYGKKVAYIKPSKGIP